ncbi:MULTISPECIES: hypothetical protein [unclassified Lentimicrobium]|uniref:hypothetical protein n=1 Tax=unclassified Lentimicrobium TaxID=2677434 RepID=UPI001554BF25|nr:MULTISPECIES: hypothetical protein [unclassified Lentimicrobium]NPD45044.1 hypothetical protein [Lentimicrobium sp. S6]NPD84561.1 hypothetical protein [Lentimicrobium sp. L6]
MDSKLITVFEGKPMEAELVNQIFIDNGIIANLKDQLMGTIAPWQVSSGGFATLKVKKLRIR